MSVLQNALRRMRPASRLPTKLEEVPADFSMVTYSERFGGYGGSRDLGLVQFNLAHMFDAGLSSDLEGMKEHLALLMVSIEQVVQDNGRWELGYQLCLLEEPPTQLWQKRGGQGHRVRAFAPLCPQRWATVALAYTKEVGEEAESTRADPEGSSRPQEEAEVPSAKAARSRRRGRMRKRRSEHHDPLSCIAVVLQLTIGVVVLLCLRLQRLREDSRFCGAEILAFSCPTKPGGCRPQRLRAQRLREDSRFCGAEILAISCPTKPGGCRPQRLVWERMMRVLRSQMVRPQGQEFEEPWMRDDVAVTKVAVPFTKWVRMHVRRLLSTRTSFSYFLLKSISNCRGRSSTASTALFPIPIPFDDIWGRPMKRMNRRRREEVARRQLVHLAVMALNFMHSTAPLSCLDLLWRRPSSLHLGVYRRLGALIKACDHVETISISGVGRGHAKLGARMREVLDTLQSWGEGLRTGYDAGLEGMKVPMVNDEEELNPYRELNASRLKLTGTGGWNCLPYLDELLVLPFMEPEVLRHEGRPRRLFSRCVERGFWGGAPPCFEMGPEQVASPDPSWGCPSWAFQVREALQQLQERNFWQDDHWQEGAEFCRGCPSWSIIGPSFRSCFASAGPH